MAKKRTIQVNGDNVVVIRQQSEDYISLTDMARFKNAVATGLVISHWLSTRYAVDFLGIWEQINNPNFNLTEFSNIRLESLNTVFIRQGIPPAERLVQLNQIAITQMQSLIENNAIKRLTEGEEETLR